MYNGILLGFTLLYIIIILNNVKHYYTLPLYRIMYNGIPLAFTLLYIIIIMNNVKHYYTLSLYRIK
jgi:hypothetical protein